MCNPKCEYSTHIDIKVYRNNKTLYTVEEYLWLHLLVKCSQFTDMHRTTQHTHWIVSKQYAIIFKRIIFNMRFKRSVVANVGLKFAKYTYTVKRLMYTMYGGQSVIYHTMRKTCNVC